MRDLFFKLLSDSHFNTGIMVTAFSIPHIVYLLLITGAIVATAIIINKKGENAKNKVLRFLAYALILSYILDFFVHDFVWPLGSDQHGMNIDKLPFHLCTAMGVVVVFAQFNKKFEKFLEPIVILAIVGPLMYLSYPAAIGEAEPWCYKTVQTMFFHGTELAWGILCITSGKVQPKFKNVWKSAIGLVIITLWAKLGNLLLDHNWFFLQEDALYIGLVQNGVIPQWSLMIFTPAAIFLIVLLIYGIYYAVKGIMNKAKAKKAV